MYYLIIYLLTQLDSLKSVLLFFSIISTVVTGIVLLVSAMAASDYCGEYKSCAISFS